MDRSEAHSKLSKIFGDVIGIDDPELKDETTADDIEEWDSLSHVRLIAAVERGFKIRFTNAEVERMTCIGDLVTAIVAKAG